MICDFATKAFMENTMSKTEGKKQDLKVSPSDKKDDKNDTKSKARLLIMNHPEVLYNAKNLFHNENGKTIIEESVPRGDAKSDSIMPRNQGDLTDSDLRELAVYASSMVDDIIAQYDQKVAYEDALQRAIGSKDSGKYAGKISASTFTLILDQMGKKKQASEETFQPVNNKESSKDELIEYIHNLAKHPNYNTDTEAIAYFAKLLEKGSANVPLSGTLAAGSSFNNYARIEGDAIIVGITFVYNPQNSYPDIEPGYYRLPVEGYESFLNNDRYEFVVFTYDPKNKTINKGKDHEVYRRFLQKIKSIAAHDPGEYFFKVRPEVVSNQEGSRQEKLKKIVSELSKSGKVSDISITNEFHEEHPNYVGVLELKSARGIPIYLFCYSKSFEVVPVALLEGTPEERVQIRQVKKAMGWYSDPKTVETALQQIDYYDKNISDKNNEGVKTKEDRMDKELIQKEIAATVKKLAALEVLACDCSVEKEAKAKAEMIKCPTCDTNVLKATGYCLRCKKKIGGADKKDEDKKEEKKEASSEKTSMESILASLDEIAGALENQKDFDLFKIAYQIDMVSDVISGKKEAATLESDPDEKYMREFFKAGLREGDSDEKSFMGEFNTDTSKELSDKYPKGLGKDASELPYKVVK
jgi:hypothetical protein